MSRQPQSPETSPLFLRCQAFWSGKGSKGGKAVWYFDWKAEETVAVGILVFTAQCGDWRGDWRPCQEHHYHPLLLLFQPHKSQTENTTIFFLWKHYSSISSLSLNILVYSFSYGRNHLKNLLFRTFFSRFMAFLGLFKTRKICLKKKTPEESIKKRRFPLVNQIIGYSFSLIIKFEDMWEDILI